MTYALKPLELALRGVNRVRRNLYRAGVLRAKRLPRPVISIGNLAIGGGGKTPAVIAVARMLIDAGYRVAVLSRGYGRQSRAPWAIVDAPDPRRFGDEPVLIARSVPGLDVVIGSDRHAAGSAYLESHDCDIFLLDDGFQHLQLVREIDIVLDQPRARWLREGPGALRDAAIVVRRGVEPYPGGYAARLEPVAIVRNERVEALDALRGASVYGFAGLADNEQFFETLRGAGAILTGARGFPDHHVYRDRDLREIRGAAAGAMLVTTEKDAVKIAEPGIAALRVAMRIEPEEAFRDELLRRMRGLVR